VPAKGFERQKYKNISKKLEKICRLRKSAYLCSPFEIKRQKSSLKRLITVQEASTEKNNLSRSVDSFERIISVGIKLEI